MKLCAALIASLLVTSTVSAKPLAKRIWQLQDYNMAHIAQVIDLAPEFGINEVQLSHHIIMDAHQALENEKLAKDVSTICRHAHSKGLKVSVWTHELEKVPEGLHVGDKVNMNDPKLWTWLTDRYGKLFDTCPGLDGLVLTFHETDVSVYSSRVVSDLSPSQRVAKLIDVLAGVCRSRGKELVVRSFCYEPSELQFIKDGFTQAKSEFVVMTKCQPHDWQPFYPNNPLIGNVGGRPQIMEIDCGHEFLGQADIPYIDCQYMKRRLSYGVSKGMVGAVARIERYGNHALDSPNWADVYVFSKLLQDTSQDAPRLLQDYLSERYGKAAAPTLASALSRTFDIVNKTYFALGFWVTDHSRLPSYGYAYGHLQRNGVDKWDQDPKWAQTKKRLMSPDTRTLNEIRREKDDALALCRKSLRELESVRSALSESDYQDLVSYLKREEAVVLTWTAYFDAFFGLLAFQESGDAQYCARAEKALVELQECGKKYDRELREVSGDGGSDNVQRIEQFAGEVQKRLAAVSVKTPS